MAIPAGRNDTAVWRWGTSRPAADRRIYRRQPAAAWRAMDAPPAAAWRLSLLRSEIAGALRAGGETTNTYLPDLLLLRGKTYCYVVQAYDNDGLPPQPAAKLRQPALLVNYLPLLSAEKKGFWKGIGDRWLSMVGIDPFESHKYGGGCPKRFWHSFHLTTAPAG